MKLMSEQTKTEFKPFYTFAHVFLALETTELNITKALWTSRGEIQSFTSLILIYDLDVIDCLGWGVQWFVNSWCKHTWVKTTLVTIMGGGKQLLKFHPSADFKVWPHFLPLSHVKNVVGKAHYVTNLAKSCSKIPLRQRSFNIISFVNPNKTLKDSHGMGIVCCG